MAITPRQLASLRVHDTRPASSVTLANLRCHANELERVSEGNEAVVTCWRATATWRSASLSALVGRNMKFHPRPVPAFQRSARGPGVLHMGFTIKSMHSAALLCSCVQPQQVSFVVFCLHVHGNAKLDVAGSCRTAR